MSKIEFSPVFVLGSPKMKSIDMSIQGPVGTGNGMYNPVFSLVPLTSWYILQAWMNCSVCSLILDQ